MLPLWMHPETHTASTGVLSRIHRFSLFRNGTESLEMLPLWMQSCYESVERQAVRDGNGKQGSGGYL